MNESPKHVVVSGGTGFIGVPLVNHLLEQGHKITVVSRDTHSVERKFGNRAAACTLETLPGKFDAVVNLAGATLNRPWTEAYKRELTNSRVETTRKLREAAEQRGATEFISASGAGYYGERGAEPCTEDMPPGYDFLATLSVEWEAAAQSNKLRVVVIRTAMVMHRDGGALKVMVPIFRWCLGGRLGNGRHYWSWIHRDDIIALYAFALENDIRGPINGAAPNPVTNREFTRILAETLHRPVSLPVPRIALRTLYGERADMLLHGQRLSAGHVLKLGFQFKYPDLAGALQAALQG
jgi:uncharacterized protein (TIGR01777 family)